MIVIARGLIVLALGSLILACSSGGSVPINYYVIDPVIESPVNGSSASLSLELTDVNIPQYLERFQIATRSGSNGLLLSESNQWGENLRKNIMRTMARNLAAALGTIDIGTPINRMSSSPDYRVRVFIEEFEQGSDGYVRLAGRWQVSNGETGETLAIYAFERASVRRIGDGEFAAIVDAMRGLLGDFCADIARSILAQEKRS